jgi:hypothetical protein
LAIALIGLGVTVAGTQVAYADWQWDGSPGDKSSSSNVDPSWGSIIEQAAETASDWQWD